MTDNYIEEMKEWAVAHHKMDMPETQVTALLYSCFKDVATWKEIGAVVRDVYHPHYALSGAGA